MFLTPMGTFRIKHNKMKRQLNTARGNHFESLIAWFIVKKDFIIPQVVNTEQ